MPGRNQKIVSIYQRQWDEIESRYNEKPEYWRELGVKSRTGLLIYLLDKALSEDTEETRLRDLYDQLVDLMQVVKENLENS